MKRLLPLLVLSLLATVGAAAQSSAFVDGLLSKKSVTVGQAAYLVLVASDNLGEDADEKRSFELLQSLGWAPFGSRVDQPIKLSSYCYILMRAFNLQGGVMYTLFPSPRYAYREMASMQVIQGVSDPSDPVDGNTAIHILSMVFDILGVF